MHPFRIRQHTVHMYIHVNIGSCPTSYNDKILKGHLCEIYTFGFFSSKETKASLIQILNSFLNIISIWTRYLDSTPIPRILSIRVRWKKLEQNMNLSQVVHRHTLFFSSVPLKQQQAVEEKNFRTYLDASIQHAEFMWIGNVHLGQIRRYKLSIFAEYVA